ncbi:MAG TPA: pyridoxamine 5'-phosphate oxidase family protein [Solirubrobacteraceae bacterium]|nr:pyridoxamine 5'-phosphate oxidase family protein [Solirubrobacteraceae bacterium]
MASWREIEAEAPELVALAARFLEARKHKTIATIRRDGSPRISGTEADLVDGELYWGSMWGAVKALDLRRDPRFALHSGSEDPPEWSGDAKVAGRAEEIDDDERKAALVAAQGNEQQPPEPWHLFRADIEELVVTRLSDARDKLVIERWRQGEGVKRIER